MQTPKAEKNRKLRLRLIDGKNCIGSYTRDDDQQQITIGSSKTADIVLPGKKISGIHAMLRLTADNDVVLYDLGSQTGTFVMGKKIVQSKVDPGVVFEIGLQKFKVEMLVNDPNNMPERKLFWEIRANSTDILDVAVIQDGKLSEMFHLEANQRLRSGHNDDELFLDGLERNIAFIERKKIENGAQGAYCYLPIGYSAEIYDARNQLVGRIEKTGDYFCLSQGQKARLVSEHCEIDIYWRNHEKRFERGTPDPETKRFKESVSVSLALSLLVIAIMSFLPQKQKEENLAEHKSSYFRVTRTEPVQAQAPAPAPGPVETVNQVVEKEPVAKVVAKQAVQKPVQKQVQVAKVVEPPKPSKQTVALQSTLSNLLNRSLTKNLPMADRGHKVMEASVVPSTSGASGLKQEISGQTSAGAVNTAALSQALKQGAAGAAAGLKGFKGAAGVGPSSGFGNAPSMDVGMGDSDAETSGGLDKSVIAAIVREHLGQIKHCYERQLIVDPNIFGKVVANWTINGEGVVDATNVKKSTMGNVTVENCVLSKIKAWKFPKPRGGGKVIVSYPFLFKSVN